MNIALYLHEFKMAATAVESDCPSPIVYQPYPKDAQLRLGQVIELYLENTGEITSWFKISCYTSRPYKIQIFVTSVSTNVHLSYNWGGQKIIQI